MSGAEETCGSYDGVGLTAHVRDEVAVALQVRRTAGEDLAEDRAEREHVAALVETLDVAERLSRALRQDDAFG